MQELRARQSTTIGRQELRERHTVEHSLAHIGHWQGNGPAILDNVKISSIYAESLLSITFMSLLEWIRFCQLNRA